MIRQAGQQDLIDRTVAEARAASTVGGGTALSTTVAYIQLPDGTETLSLLPHTFAGGAIVVKVDFNPYLVVLKTTDNLASVTDYSSAAQDGSTDTDVVLSSLSTLVNGDFLLVGAKVPFGGLRVDVDAANGNAATILAEFWNGTAWTDITATDGSAAAGATFGQDGSITWTMPATWVASTLRAINTPAPASSVLHVDEPLYWLRISVSAALDASSTLNSVLAMNRAAVPMELVATTVPLFLRAPKGIGGVGNLAALTDAGTAKLIVNAHVPLAFT